MTELDERRILAGLDNATRDALDDLEVFETIGSTNSYLADAARPAPGRVRIAIAEQQTAGRGRHNREWVSPKGSGLYQSLAFTVGATREDFSALTLALGVGAINALERLAIGGVKLKWPNDLVAEDSKLGGLLTETRLAGGRMTVIAGIGINLRMDDATRIASRSAWAQQAIALEHLDAVVPDRNALASAIASELTRVFLEFAEEGFGPYADAWRKADWLLGKEIKVESPANTVIGVASGVTDDGSLRLDTSDGSTVVSAGTVSLLGGAR